MIVYLNVHYRIYELYDQYTCYESIVPVLKNCDTHKVI